MSVIKIKDSCNQRSKCTYQPFYFEIQCAIEIHTYERIYYYYNYLINVLFFGRQLVSCPRLTR